MINLRVDVGALTYEDALGVIDAMHDQALDELGPFDFQVDVARVFGWNELAARVEALDEARRNLFTHAVEEAV